MIPSQIQVHVLDERKRKFLQLRWNDPATGQVRKRSAKTTSRRDAERRAAQLEKELRAGCAPDAITWYEFRDRHEQEARTGRAQNTCEKYDHALDHVERILKPKCLRDLTPGRLSEFVRTLSTEESKRTKKQRSPHTVAIICRHLKAALRWAKDMGLLSYQPSIKPPKTSCDDAKGRPITGEEFDRMIAKVKPVVFPNGFDQKNPERADSQRATVEDWKSSCAGYGGQACALAKRFSCLGMKAQSACN